MFAVEWLRQGVTVERESFALADLANAVTIARWRAVAVAARHPLEKPDGFRLIDDSTGAFVLTVKLYDRERCDASTFRDGSERRPFGPEFHSIVSLLL
jgi:hypothetical protein